MKRFKNILYVVDTEPSPEEANVSDKVANLAKLNNARVTLAGISDEHPLLEQFNKLLSAKFEKLENQLTAQKMSAIQELLSTDRWKGLEVESCFLHGKDFVSIIQKVLQDKHDLVIKKRTTAEDEDALAMRLFRKCPCPVWIIDGSQSTDFKKVLGAIDVNSNENETKQLNKKIIELTSSLAQRESGEAHYLHAWELPHEVMLRSPRFNVAEQELVQMKQDLATTLEETFQKTLAEAGVAGPPGHVHLEEGEVSKVIQYVMDSLEIDVLIMGSIARSGIPGLLIGNSAEKILTETKCSVLAVKPDGFISPVTE
jgi:nucleotide-binding universal stress UspA family protein